jgi:alpha-tubulin suppressor-like RCC1 family protein
VWSWGEDALHEASRVPVQVEGLTGVNAVSVGTRHSAALKGDGTVWVWGYHGAGDQGNGEYGLAGLPLAIRGLTGVVAIAAASNHSVPLVGGSPWAWGQNEGGALGVDDEELSRSEIPMRRVPASGRRRSPARNGLKCLRSTCDCRYLAMCRIRTERRPARRHHSQESDGS